MSVTPDEIYEKLLQIYGRSYRNPKAVLDYHISELLKEGKTREDAILSLYEQEQKRAEAEKQAEAKKPLSERVKELEDELSRLRRSRIVETEVTSVELPSSGLTLGEAIVLVLFSPIAPIIAWLIWHEDEPYKADQVVSILIIMLIVEVIILWFLLFLI